jgi:hypothetical protein
MLTMHDIYSTAKNFLIKQIPSADAKNILESYLLLPDKSNEPVSLDELFRRLLDSAQNANMKASVVGGSIDGIDNLGKALFGFDPVKVKAKYYGDPDRLLEDIVKILRPRGQIRRGPRCIWPNYCKTIISSAAFFGEFSCGEDFYEWANHLYRDQRSMAALPMILAAEIEGIGYPLACDFLKELGFVNYGKPDVQLFDIFVGVGLCKQGASAYHVQKIISQIASEAGVSSYNVDKLFWLIGSGKFYNHLELGNNGQIGEKKNQFIAEFNANR